MHVLNGIGKQGVQILLRQGGAGRLRPIGTGHHLHLAQHHVRVVDEVAVHLDAVFIGGQMDPFRFNIHHSVPLLEKQNVRHHLSTGSGLKGVVGKPNGPQQVGPLCDVFPGAAGALIHGEAGGDKSDDAAGTHFVQRFGDKILMDGQIQPVIPLVQYLKLAEGDIADGHIKEIVWEVHLLKAPDTDAGLLVEVPGYDAGHIIQFYAVQLAARHAVREHTEEIAGAAGWLQDIAL